MRSNGWLNLRKQATSERHTHRTLSPRGPEGTCVAYGRLLNRDSREDQPSLLFIEFMTQFLTNKTTGVFVKQYLCFESAAQKKWQKEVWIQQHLTLYFIHSNTLYIHIKTIHRTVFHLLTRLGTHRDSQVLTTQGTRTHNLGMIEFCCLSGASALKCYESMLITIIFKA